MAKPNIPPEAGYNISIVGRHFQITDPIRTYVFEKLSRVDRLTDKITDVHVTLEVQGLLQSCSMLMHVYHNQIKVTAATDNVYSAIDKCMDKLTNLVRRYKTKLQSKRAMDVSAVDIHVNVVKALKNEMKAINDSIDEETERREKERMSIHEIIGKETVPLRTLTHDEAVMKMEICDDAFLIFRSEEDQKIKVIYRRSDGNYNVVQTH